MVNFSHSVGVYEALRTYAGVLALLPEHQARLRRSCEAMGLVCPDLEALLADRRPGPERDVRLRVEVRSDGVRVEERDLPRWHGSFLYPERWKVRVFDGARAQPEVKTLDTAMQYEAREAAWREGYDEILLVNAAGLVVEGGITNVFFVEGERLVTPGQGMLPGIGRALVLQAAEALGIEVALRDVRVEELPDFDAVFLTNSVRGLVATGEVHPLMQRLADWCTDFIRGRVADGS